MDVFKICNLGVVGSNPTRGSSKKDRCLARCLSFYLYANKSPSSINKKEILEKKPQTILLNKKKL